MNYRHYIAVAVMALSGAAFAQDGGAPVTAPAPVVFGSESKGTVDAIAPGSGDDSSAYAPEFPRIPAPPRTVISCSNLDGYQASLGALYGNDASGQRPDRSLLDTALASYRKHVCTGAAMGPGAIVVVDFARKSSDPRLWLIDLATGKGMDEPVLVTHGIGSDFDDDGVLDRFSNIKDSLMSSPGAVRGAEVYFGKNGRSLRLDGLDPTNSEIRRRDIVVHSVNAKKRTYFRADYLAKRNGVVGTSEGCFVVVPERRDWLIDSLSNGGFLYAGASGERGAAMIAAMTAPPVPTQLPDGTQIIFASKSAQAVADNVEPAATASPAGGAPVVGPTGPIAPITSQ